MAICFFILTFILNWLEKGVTELKELVVYTKTNCPDCAMIISYLLDNRIPFRQVDVKSKKQKNELFIKEFPSVVFEQDGFPDCYVEGYNPKELVKVINKFRTKKCNGCKER